MGDLPAWMSDADDKRRQNKRSGAQERARAKQVGGRVQAGSGSSWRAPQDVISADYVEQIKYTDAASFILKIAELQGLLSDGYRAGKSPRMVVDFSAYGIRAIIDLERL